MASHMNDKFPKFPDKKTLNDWMETFVRDPFHRLFEAKSFRVDMYETDHSVVVEAELPGFHKDQIEIEAFDSSLRISVKHTEIFETENENEQYFKKERSYQHLERVIPIPYRIDEGTARARYEKGILTVLIPKGGKVRKRFIDIN